MPTYPLNNPYYLSGERTIKSSTQLGAKDLQYIRALIPNLTGETDKILSILFHDFVNLLKSHEQLSGPIEPAFFVDHPTYSFIQSVIQRRAPGLTPHEDGPRDDGRGATAVRPTHGDDAGERAVEEEGTLGAESKIPTKDRGKEIPSEPSPGHPIRPVDPLAQLRSLNADLYGIAD